MIRLALTGATGFVGRAALSHLLAAGHQVRALLRAGRTLPAHERLSPVAGTLEEPSSLRELVQDCDAVIHVAGAISGRNYEEFAATNVAGTARLIDALRNCAPSAQLIHLSSLAAREPQLSDYTASKRAGEQLVVDSGLDGIILRPPAVYGPNDPALAPLWRLLARGWLPRVGPPAARFSLLHVDDLSAALCRLAATRNRGMHMACIHDGTPGGFSWSDIASIAARVRKGKVRVAPVPAFLLHTAGWCNLTGARWRRRRPSPLVPGKVRELAHPDWVCDNTQLPGCPEWKPVMKFEQALLDLPGWTRFR